MKKHFIPKLINLFILLSLIPTSQADETLASFKVKSASGNASLPIKWDPKLGLNIEIASKQKMQKVILNLIPNNCSATLQQIDINQPLSKAIITTQNLPSLPENYKLLIKFRSYFWDIFLAGKRIIRLPTIFHDPAEINIPKHVLATNSKNKYRFQKYSSIFFQDEFMISKEEANQLGEWETLCGNWHIHSAQQDALSQESSPRLTTRPLEAARSANFYSLKGKGSPGLISSGYSFYDYYSIKAAIQLSPGTAGLAFYISDKDSFFSFSAQQFEDSSQPVLLTLKKHSSNTPPEMIKAATTQLLPLQWINLKVDIAFDNTVSCYLDNILIFKKQLDLPSGGKFGLLVNSKDDIRFDDITVKSTASLPLANIENLKFFCINKSKNTFFKPNWLNWLWTDDLDEQRPFYGSCNHPRWLLLGSEYNSNTCLEATFNPDSTNGEYGILLGWKPNNTCWLFKVKSSDKTHKFQLMTTALNPNNTQGNIILSNSTKRTDAVIQPFRLKVFFDQQGIAHFYYDNSLVLIYQFEDELTGASGLWLAQDTEAPVSSIKYGQSESPTAIDKQEKNEVFRTDPYMRHWASPEGNWLPENIKSSKKEEQLAANQLWTHKSHFFGPFEIQLPLLNKTEVNLGVKETLPNGQYTLLVDDNTISLKNNKAAQLLASAKASNLFKLSNLSKIESTIKTDFIFYKLHIEDKWLWITYNDTLIYKQLLPEKLYGTKLTIKGFSQEAIAQINTVRQNVKDFLFTQAPYDWVKNGGKWQIINRFQCDPRWSHMNGESKDSLAALWSKWLLAGDFCLEMYAGTRHSPDWYKRVGDFNITIMNQDPTPFQGYTFLCSSWDNNNSQRYSKFYKNGTLIDQKDTYLTPRYRDGNRRLFFNPFISTGRDVHGAWYYIKVTRLGNKITYYFDNQKVFSFQDDKPIEKGSFGIWTYLASMMVARLKIAAHTLSPKPVSFIPIPAEQAVKSEKISPPPTIQSNTFSAEGVLLNPIKNKKWEIPYEAGLPYISYKETNNHINMFTVTNRYQGGRFYAKSTLPPTPTSKIAGWTFKVKRMPKTKFNFYYNLVKKSNNTFSVIKQFFYQLSDSPDNNPDYHKTGQTIVPSSTSPANWAQESSWQKITIWLPLEYFNSKEYYWQISGFGNLHPGDIAMGLSGNFPGSSYAIKDFKPILGNTPTLTQREKFPLANYSLNVNNTECDVNSLNQLNSLLKKHTKAGLNNATITSENNKTNICWVNQATTPLFSCKWSKDKWYTIRITTNLQFADPNIADLKAFVEDYPAPLKYITHSEYELRLPLTPDSKQIEALSKPELTITLQAGKFKQALKIATKNAPLKTPPLLLSVKHLPYLFENFEGKQDKAQIYSPIAQQQTYFDPQLKSYATKVFNKTYNQRLKTHIKLPILLSEYPLLQFDYKTDDMGLLTIQTRYDAFLNLNEGYKKAQEGTLSTKKFTNDNSWHTWTGKLTDAYKKHDFHKWLFKPGVITIYSAKRVDQTGNHSTLNLDNIILGPAVSDSKKLKFTPIYYSFYSPLKVYYSLSPATMEKTSYKWHEIKNKETIIPDISNLKDGYNQLSLKAIDINGTESAISSIPFLLDRTALHVKAKIRENKKVTNNGTELIIYAKNKQQVPVSDFAISKLKLKFNNSTVYPYSLGSSIRFNKNKTVISINWPYILRHHLQNMKNGDIGNLKISQIQDGAGNISPDITIPIKIDFETDKTTPSYYHQQTPEFIGYRLPTLYRHKKIHFMHTRHLKTELLHASASEPYVKLTPTQATAIATFPMRSRHKEIPLSCTNYPYLALRIRFIKQENIPNAALNLKVCLDNNQQLLLNLAGLDHSKHGYTTIKTPFNLESEEWQTAFIDLSQYLTDKAKYPDLNKLMIKDVILDIKHFQNTPALDLSSLTLFSQSNGKETIKLNCYDQSGIKGFDWEFTGLDNNIIKQGQQTGFTFSINQLPKGKGWLTRYAIDRAGNKANPIRVPVILK